MQVKRGSTCRNKKCPGNALGLVCNGSRAVRRGCPGIVLTLPKREVGSKGGE
jgi:hypothetical protein